MNGESILCLAAAYVDRSKLTKSTISTYASGSGDLLGRLGSGHDITTRRAAKITKWFSDHWPIDLAWPADIPRPPPAEDSPYALALAAQAQNLNESAKDSENPLNPLSLNSRGELASPKALAASLLPSYAGEAQMQSMLDSYYQLTRQYADGCACADKSPRKGTQAARLLDALIQAGDVRFQARIDQAAEFRAISERLGLAS